VGKEETPLKRTWKLLILFLALAVVAGAYILAQNLGKPADTKEESGKYPLIAKSAGELSGFGWAADGNEFSFVKKDGQWAVDKGTVFPVNQEAVQGLADKLLGLTAVRKLTGIKALADYGLDSPGFTVKAAWADGTGTSYAMGAETPFKDGHYAIASDAPDTV